MLQTLRERSQKRKKLLAQTVRTTQTWFHDVEVMIANKSLWMVRIRFFHVVRCFECRRVAANSWNGCRRYAKEKIEIGIREIRERSERFKRWDSSDRRNRLQRLVDVFKGRRVCIHNQATICFHFRLRIYFLRERNRRIRIMTTVNISSTRVSDLKISLGTWVWRTDSRNTRNCGSWSSWKMI